MGFEPLELFVRVEIGVLVIEADNHSDVDEVGLHVVEESTRVGAGIDWPTDCVLHVSRLEQSAAGIHLPYLFQANTVKLRIAFVSELELVHYFL